MITRKKEKDLSLFFKGQLTPPENLCHAKSRQTGGSGKALRCCTAGHTCRLPSCQPAGVSTSGSVRLPRFRVPGPSPRTCPGRIRAHPSHHWVTTSSQLRLCFHALVFVPLTRTRVSLHNHKVTLGQPRGETPPQTFDRQLPGLCFN